ncbi:hypothetical protein JL721_1486 [Aureococcus anophagefferens]|nr:hypothetical protein JL721_1486 [Aureococcus anophagefferens]
MAAAMFDSRPIEIARPLLFESEEGAPAPSRPRRAQAQVAQEEAQGARRGAAAGRRAKKKKKKRSRRRAAPPAEISGTARAHAQHRGRQQKRSLGLIHPPPEVVADPEHRGGPARGPASLAAPSALPQAQS